MSSLGLPSLRPRAPKAVTALSGKGFRVAIAKRVAESPRPVRGEADCADVPDSAAFPCDIRANASLSFGASKRSHKSVDVCFDFESRGVSPESSHDDQVLPVRGHGRCAGRRAGTSGRRTLAGRRGHGNLAGLDGSEASFEGREHAVKPRLIPLQCVDSATHGPSARENLLLCVQRCGLLTRYDVDCLHVLLILDRVDAIRSTPVRSRQD